MTMVTDAMSPVDDDFVWGMGGVVRLLDMTALTEHTITRRGGSQPIAAQGAKSNSITHLTVHMGT
jgi:hypothetical protein